MKTAMKIKREYIPMHDMYSLERKLEAAHMTFVRIYKRHSQFKTVAVLVWWYEEREETIHETVYGDLSEAEDVVFLEENHIRQIIRENLPRIIEAREEFVGTDGEFLGRLLGMIFCHREEILGDEEMRSGFRRSNWAGEPPVGIWRKALIPNERISVPFRISAKVVEGRFVPLIDLDHLDADLMSAWEWYGSASHGRSVQVIWSTATGKGFDLSRSEWPKNIPVNYMTLRRVVDERGESRNCRGNYPPVYSIDRLFN